jgi:hypothetical protein
MANDNEKFKHPYWSEDNDLGGPSRSVPPQGRVDQDGTHHGILVMGKLQAASDHPEIHGREEGGMTFVEWGGRYFAVKENGDIYDMQGKLEIVPDGLKKAIKDAGINEEANSNS